MLEWLTEVFQADADLSVRALIFQLGLALVLGLVVAGIYRGTLGSGRSQAQGLTATLVLLTVLIAMITLVIGSNVARAFSLVGALSIVRFRTVVEDTRDTAFVIFAVGVGMAAGAGREFLPVLVVGIPVAGLAAFLMRPRGGAQALARDFLLSVRIGAGHEPYRLLRSTFDKHLEQATLKGTATARQGAAFELTYAVRLRREDGAVPLAGELNAIEGVQSVELRQA
jgi:hypothetical protein